MDPVWLAAQDAIQRYAELRLVTKNETLLYYPEGWTAPSAKRPCQPCEYQVLYKLELIGRRWYIAEKDVRD